MNESELKPSGSIYFWKYKTDGVDGEWHFSADDAGCVFLKQLLDRMEEAEDVCRYLVPLTPVTHALLEAPNYGSPHENRTGLRLTYKPFDSNHYDWLISDNEKIVDVLIGKTMLAEWRRAVADIQNGSGGYTIGLFEDDTIFIWENK